MSAASNRVQQAQTELEEAEQHLQDQRQLQSTLAAAAEQVGRARDQLDGDADLAAAYDRLVHRSDQLRQQSVEMQARRDQSNARMQRCEQELAADRKQLEKLAAEFARCDKAAAELDQALMTASADQEKAEVARDLARERLRTSLTQRFVVGSLQALSPEQMAASVICALNLAPRFRAEAEAEWQNNNKDKPADQIDSKQREQETLALARKRRQQVESSFVSLFAATPGSPQDTFFATVDQALFLSNDGRLQSWISPRHGNLAERLKDQPRNELVARDLYRSILTRDPTDDERDAVLDYLQASADTRPAAIQELIWSLLTSAEFRFNH